MYRERNETPHKRRHIKADTDIVMVEAGSGRQEFEAVNKVWKTTPRPGEKWYLVSTRWLEAWRAYVNDPSGKVRRPGPVDNHRLTDPDATPETLREDLMEQQDFDLVCEEAWMKLLKLYGGGPTFARSVVPNGRESVVEVYLMKFTVSLRSTRASETSNGGTEHTVENVSRITTVLNLKKKLSALLKIPHNEMMLFDAMCGESDLRALEQDDATLSDLGLVRGQTIVLERTNGNSVGTSLNGTAIHSNGSRVIDGAHADLEKDDGEMTPSKPPLALTNGEASPNKGNGPGTAATFRFADKSESAPITSTALTISSPRSGDIVNGSVKDMNFSLKMPDGGPFSPARLNAKAGLTGLNNLGNSCFMNSALQCLSNTQELTEFFLSGDYVEDVNPDNPIGMGGVLAQNYARVLRALWGEQHDAYAPRTFKHEIALFAPQFSGYAQQDSQELLAFLLDGIHEDLNRITKKPFVESIEGGDRPDNEVADESWRNHKRRHDSIIVDLFQGQYKSTVVCPTCSKVSVTFDPFMYLTLPLPTKRERNVTFVFFALPTDSTKPALPVRYTVQVPNTGTVKDLRYAIAFMCGVPANRLMLADCVIMKLYDVPFLDSKKIEDTFRDNSISSTWVVYEVDHDIEVALGGTSPMFQPPRAYTRYPEETLPPSPPPDFVVVDVSQKVEGDPSNAAVPFIVTFDREKFTGRRLAESIKRRTGVYIDFAMADEQREDVGESQSAGIHNYCRATMRRKDSIEAVAIDLESEDVIELTDDTGMVSVFIEWAQGDWFHRDRSGLKMAENHRSVAEAQTVPKKPQVTLSTCLSLWGEKETLSEDNAWYCPRCHEHKQASKSLVLWRVPDILVVHLKRFSYTTYSRNKLETFVDYPLEDFDISSFVSGSLPAGGAMYDLYAISNHYGGLGGGHYTAHSKSPWKPMNGSSESTGWYNYDDSYVSPIANRESIRSNNAYVLFYRRRRGSSQ